MSDDVKALIAELSIDHKAVDAALWCATDGLAWPCPTAQVVAALEATRQALAMKYEYSRHSLDSWEESPRRKITEAEAREYAPDGHRANGEPYWNYRVERRVKAGPWERWTVTDG